MKQKERLERLLERYRKYQGLQAAIRLFHWDRETMMPHKGDPGRIRCLVSLNQLAREFYRDTETRDLYYGLVERETGRVREGVPDKWYFSLAREYRKFRAAELVPDKVESSRIRVENELRSLWEEARRSGRIQSLLPKFKEMIKVKRQVARYMGFEENIHDYYLEIYEPGWSGERYRALFDLLVPAVRELLLRIDRKGSPQKISAPTEDEMPALLRSCHRLVETMGIPRDCYRLDTVTHPFAIDIHHNDQRITTRFTDSLPDSVLAVIHESGHSLYNQNLPERYRGTPLGEPISLGVHESQSRIWECCVAKNRRFWAKRFRQLKKSCPRTLARVSFDDWMQALTRVEPGTIRVTADDISYHLHIYIRFYLEEKLLNGEIDPQEIPTVWKELYRDWLGVSPRNHREGFLQDVHWFQGTIGYFPTYSLGHIIAVQLFECFLAEHKLDEREFFRGDIRVLTRWLVKNVHSKGSAMNSLQLVRRVTRKEISPLTFIESVREKYEI